MDIIAVILTFKEKLMDLKLVRDDVTSKPKKTTLKKVEEIVAKTGTAIIYFDRDNSHKDLIALGEHFEETEKSFYMREVRYGLNDNDYMYEVHVL